MEQAAFPHGDVDYDSAGARYAQQRRADPEIAKVILDALGDARSVLNVGAGTGNYEPTDRQVVALEPSATMRAQRPLNAAPCVIGVAQNLPFDDDSFDAVMSICSIHQWTDLARGLSEMRRVARGRVAILTFDPTAFDRHWFYEYTPEVVKTEAQRCPAIDHVCALLGKDCTVSTVPIPLHCTDGLNEAFYGRPEMLLKPEVRAAQSVWLKAGRAAETEAIARLTKDLASGGWDARFGHLRTQAFFEGSLRLIVWRR
jgi:SAM-dependent methyltransferase